MSRPHLRRIRRAPTGHRVGSSHSRSKLDEHDVALIRSLHDEGLSCRTIAEKFDVGKSVINYIITGARRAYD